MKSWKLVLLFMSVCLLTACNKEEENTLPSNDQKIAWQIEQEKSFGKYYDTGLNEEEMHKVIVDRFGLNVPKFLSEGTELLDNTLSKDGAKKVDTQYEVEATGNSLFIRGMYVYQWPDENYYVYGTSVIQYGWNSNLNLAYLEVQQIDIVQQQSETEHLKDSLNIVKSLSEMINLEDADEKMSSFKEAYEKGTEALVNQVFTIENTTKQAITERGMGRVLEISFDEFGKVAKIYTYTRDNSKKPVKESMETDTEASTEQTVEVSTE